jgi:GT2 family glycosyltransferase
LNQNIAVSILNYNGYDDTLDCLQSLFLSEFKFFEVFIVDNCSPNNDFIKFIKFFESETDYKPTKPTDWIFKSAIYYYQQTIKIHLISSGKNGGFAFGHNMGIKYIQACDSVFSYYWLLNNDVIVQSSNMSELVAFHQSQAHLALVGTVQYFKDDRERIQSSAVGFHKLSAKFWNCKDLNFKEDDGYFVYGASMFLPSRTITNVGLLPESYFMYYEEADYCLRLIKLGYSYQVAKHIGLFHGHGATTGNMGSWFRIKYLLLNKVRFYKRNFPALTPLAFLIVCIDILKVLKNNFKCQLKTKNKQ